VIIEPQMERNNFAASDYNENFLLAETSLEKLITSVCARQWEKELVEKFGRGYTIKGIVTSTQKVPV
jgi:hypothetical protein